MSTQKKNICSKCHIFSFTSNTRLGKFGSKIIDGRLLIEDLRYVPKNTFTYMPCKNVFLQKVRTQVFECQNHDTLSQRRLEPGKETPEGFFQVRSQKEYQNVVIISFVHLEKINIFCFMLKSVAQKLSLPRPLEK